MLAAVAARGAVPNRILEPTCGSGAFLAAAAAAFPMAELLGVELQRERYGAALDALQHRLPQLTVRYANAYETDFAALSWRGAGPLLIAGNPPWVTAAALGRAPAGAVQPPRSNPKGLRGLAARTGAANFDVAEFLILKLLRDLGGEPVELALLVKESVARNILTAARELHVGIMRAEIVRIDARAWFAAAVDACCLLASVAPGAPRARSAALRAAFAAPAEARIPFDRPALKRKPPVIFRQGIKHDAADVFELRADGDGWRNGYGEPVDIEPEYRFPLLKARALHADEAVGAAALIVPQMRLGAPTDGLADCAPRLWRYLNAHGARISARRSSIYRSAPRFALFGLGPYSFAPWKVAVAGLYAQPRFRLIGPHGGRPVVFGDTAYFAAFECEAQARAFAALCASPALAAQVAQRVVRGKRPITKGLLDTLDWAAAAAIAR